MESFRYYAFRNSQGGHRSLYRYGGETIFAKWSGTEWVVSIEASNAIGEAMWGELNYDELTEEYVEICFPGSVTVNALG